MKIGQMFQKEIKPDFNGVIQVQDEDTRTLVTELDPMSVFGSPASSEVVNPIS